MTSDFQDRLTEISAKLGFSELKYFCALFKKQVGLTPTAYRNQKEKTQ